MQATLDEDFIHDTRPEERYTYAGFWIRVGAAIIDGLILAPLSFIDDIQQSLVGSGIISTALLALNFLYKPVLEATRQATFGKQLLNMKVVRTDLAPISWTESITRYIPWILMSVFIYGAGFIYGIDFTDEVKVEEQIEGNMGNLISMATIVGLSSLLYIVSVIVVAFDKRKQGLHDKLAKTFVVIKKP